MSKKVVVFTTRHIGEEGLFSEANGQFLNEIELYRFLFKEYFEKTSRWGNTVERVELQLILLLHFRNTCSEILKSLNEIISHPESDILKEDLIRHHMDVPLDKINIVNKTYEICEIPEFMNIIMAKWEEYTNNEEEIFKEGWNDCFNKTFSLGKNKEIKLNDYINLNNNITTTDCLNTRLTYYKSSSSSDDIAFYALWPLLNQQDKDDTGAWLWVKLLKRYFRDILNPDCERLILILHDRDIVSSQVFRIIEESDHN